MGSDVHAYIHTYDTGGSHSPDVQQHAVSIPNIHDMISNRAQTIDPSNCSHAAGGWLLPAKNTPTQLLFFFPLSLCYAGRVISALG